MTEYAVEVTTCEGGGLAVCVHDSMAEDDTIYRFTGRLGRLAHWWWKEMCEVAERREHTEMVESTGFFLFAEAEVLHMYGQGQRSTSRNYENALASFRTYCGGKELLMQALSPELIDGYERWLIKRGVCLNTVSNYMRALRALYNKAVRRSLVRQKEPFRRVFTKSEETVKRAIDPKDIRRLMDLKLPEKSSLELARDLFLFSFYARGMPFVDIAYLRQDQMRDGYLEYKRRKTNQQLRIKMEPCMEELVSRYRCPDSLYVFPILTREDADEADRQYRSRSCYYNKLLKHLGELLNLPVPLSYYVARHSWASAAYQAGVELETISRALGHASVRTTLIYIRRLGNDPIINRANAHLLKQMLAPKDDNGYEPDWEERKIR